MATVTILTISETIILKAQNSELLVLKEHVDALKQLNDHQKFCDYFLYTALLNRSARKLFESWLRKNPTLWERIYKEVHGQKDKKNDDPKLKESPEIDSSQQKDQITEPQVGK